MNDMFDKLRSMNFNQGIPAGMQLNSRLYTDSHTALE